MDELTISTGDELVTQSGRVEVCGMYEENSVEVVQLRPIGGTERFTISRSDLRKGFEKGLVRPVTSGE